MLSNGFIGILVVAIVIAIVVFRLWYNSAIQKGKRGEKYVAKLLERLPSGYYSMNDIILKNDYGTTQIDHIIVSKYAVFAIETKNYTGDIYGSDTRSDWTQIIVTEVQYKRNPFKTYTNVTKNKFYNPVKQALGHVYCLRKLLKDFNQYLPIIPVVIFTGDAIIKDVKTSHEVIYEDELLSVLEKYKTTYLSDKDVTAVFTLLHNENVRNEVTNKQHVQNIKNSKKQIEAIIDSGICPRCGGQLIERKGRYGKFIGCSNYPKCKYTCS